jgi:hypothetical protein
MAQTRKNQPNWTNRQFCGALPLGNEGLAVRTAIERR